MTRRKSPISGSKRGKVVEYLRKKGSPATTKEIREAIGVNAVMVSMTASAYPNIIKKVKKGLFEYIDLEPDQTDLVKRETSSPFIVPVSRLIQSAKNARPHLRAFRDAELIRRHVVTNKNVFVDGVDYQGDIVTDIRLTYRASLKLSTILGVPDVRSQIEEDKARAEGRDHIKDFDLSRLMPDGAPEGHPVCFDALIEALGLNRHWAIKSLTSFSSGYSKNSSNVHRTRPRDCYWLSEYTAKRFLLESGISPERKAPIYDYFIRREQEAEDYRQRDKQEQAIETSDLAAALAGMAQAVTSMVTQQQQTTALLTQLVTRQTAQEERLDASEERARLAEEKADEHYHGMTRRIEVMTYEYPYSAHAVSEKVGLYTKAGKPHFMCVRSLAERLSLMDHGLAVYDSESGPHQFVRLNKGGLEVMREWRAECLENGETFLSFPRSKSSSWHIYLLRPDS